MMKVASIWFSFIGGMLMCGICSKFTNAQVIPDKTLKTTVSQSGTNFTITDGTRVGNNLFHSFSQFSILTKGSAFFNNPSDIRNIFSRVTGSNVSNIDGLIQANGNANLFLLNPNGIIFGPNASLNIGGSFVATTAESIKFADGAKFSVTDTAAPPLLTMSVPIGLQLGTNAGTIKVQGTLAPNFFGRPPQSFKAPAVALIGSNIDINAATISIPDGQVELWALQNAEVGLNSQTGLELTSPIFADWGTISLRQSSLIDSSGLNGGPINIRGRGLTLQEGSAIFSTTGDFGKGKGINVKTTEFVDLLGVSTAEQYATPGLLTSTFADRATAGDITVETSRLGIANGGWIVSTVGSNDSRTGDINIRASNIEINGYNPFAANYFHPSAITTLITGGNRNVSGKITVDAQRINLLNGGRISADLFGVDSLTTGKSGDIFIQASESLEISGITPLGLTGAVISSIESLAEGIGGNITINTGRLLLYKGGSVSTAVGGSGKAGNIDINAKDIEVSDPVFDNYTNTASGITVAVGANAIGQSGNINLIADRLHVFNGGQINSSTQAIGNAGNLNLQVKNIDVQGISENLVNGHQLPSAITASSTTPSTAGTVNILSDAVTVRDGAQITVSNTGTGDAGNFNISSNTIFLDNGASLGSEANGGSQGNIHLKANDVLLLRHGSNITTNARDTSIGGNINITAGAIVAVPKENSDITANAVLGSGGNIQITTQGVLGLKYSPQVTPESDITASSKFGLSGTVQVNNVGIDPNSGLVQLPQNITDSSQKIATGCSSNNGSSFVATGRGGIPQNPNQQLMSDRTWADIRNPSQYRKNNQVTAKIPEVPEVLIQATGWHRNAQGEIELVANNAPTQVQPPLTCAAVPQN